MSTGFQSLMAWCGAVPTGGGILATLAVAGLAGAPMHCGPMCGGFVLGQVADRMAALPVARFCEWRRLRAGLLLPYHLGRLTTYALLGALAGAGGGALTQLPWFGRLSALLLLCGAALFLVQALRRLAPRVGAAIPSLDRAPSGWSRLLARTAGRIDRGRPRGGYALGALLGFLPCGMLYAALIAVAGTGSAALGAAAMLAFGLGTAPTLMLIGLAGQAAGGRWQATIARVSPALLLLNAALLAALALRGLAGTA